VSQGGRRALLAFLGAAGLALYLWPALKAPVVLWSDSEIDLAWARDGVGIVSPAPPPPSAHPAKPGWIAFLRAASVGSIADGVPRRIVIIQMALLWLSIAGVCVFLGRRTSFARGAVLYAVLVIFLRLPDSATAVMSEALTAALLLPIVAALLDPPARAWPAFALGAASGLLFLVRPNAGAVAGTLAVLACAAMRRWRALPSFAAGAIVLVLPVWLLTDPPGRDPLRGLGPVLVWARAEYGWINVAGLPPPDRSEAFRQSVWRLGHGLLGGEHYDASWSTAWAMLDEASRFVSPFLVLLALACLLAPPRERSSLPRILGLALAGMLVVQSFFLGALPRFALPMLPALFLCVAAAWPPIKSVAAATFVILVAAARWQRQVLDREWGRIEAPGIRIAQTLPKGALPMAQGSVLRIRVAPALVPSNAGLSVLGPSGEVLYDSRGDTDRRRPFIEMPLSPEILAANQRGPVTLTLVSAGDYGESQYLLFPVIPAPWAPSAEREGSSVLSPSTGLRSGSLDWWVDSDAR